LLEFFLKKLLALALLIAAAAGGPATSLAHNGMQGGGHVGGFHGNAGARAFHGFGGAPVHHAFPVRRSFVVIGAAFPLAYYAYPTVGYVGGQPLYLYCQDPAGYYPDIQYCPTGWLQVVQ
jgi:hypothetical protein